MKDSDQLLADALSGRNRSIPSPASSPSRTMSSPDLIPSVAVIDTRTGSPGSTTRSFAWGGSHPRGSSTASSRWPARWRSRASTRSSSTTWRLPHRRQARRRASTCRSPRQVRIETIAGFSPRRRKELAHWVFAAADVFGYTAFNAQTPISGSGSKDMAPHLDYFSPMVYPSGYHMGIPGFRNPVNHSYEIVREACGSPASARRDAASRCVMAAGLQGLRRSTSAFPRGTRDPGAGARRGRGGRHRLDALNPRNDYTAGGLRPAALLAKKTAAVQP